MRRKPTRGQFTTWARINAYGLLLVGLLLLTFTQIIHPETSTTARLLGGPHFLQQYWSAAFLMAAFLLLWGFLSARTWPEVFGLVFLIAGQVTRTIVVNNALGWFTEEGLSGTGVGIILIVVACLRLTVLTSKDGLVITIPGRAGHLGQRSDDGH